MEPEGHQADWFEEGPHTRSCHFKRKFILQRVNIPPQKRGGYCGCNMFLLEVTHSTVWPIYKLWKGEGRYHGLRDQGGQSKTWAVEEERRWRTRFWFAWLEIQSGKQLSKCSVDLLGKQCWGSASGLACEETRHEAPMADSALPALRLGPLGQGGCSQQHERGRSPGRLSLEPSPHLWWKSRSLCMVDHQEETRRVGRVHSLA